jgi:hypothetical protein
MTRGYKPIVAIGEAQRKATAWGFLLIVLETEAQFPFDFVIDDRGRNKPCPDPATEVFAVWDIGYPEIL